MRRSRRAIAVAAIAGAAVIIMGPAVVGAYYADGPGGVHGVNGRPDKGWQFLWQAVTHSRTAQLGSAQSATQRARDAWAGARPRQGSRPAARSTARASDVRLVWTDGPFEVPVTADGVRPAPANAVAHPRGPFAWMVYGSMRGGPRQMIGMLDYDSGRVLWDIRDRWARP